MDRRRSRSLASEKRAGSWLRRRATEQQRRFLRENLRIIGVFLVVYVAVLPLVWLQAAPIRGFMLGALTASIVWLIVLVTWQLSGVAHLQQGELAERWTVQQLRPLTKRGEWLLINHVLLRPWDIDHVLIGPAGVVVIETKGGNSDWTEPRHAPRIRDAIRQVTDNAGDTRRYLRPDIAGAPVHSVVALWPASADIPTREVDTAVVLSGHRLTDWIGSLPIGQLEPAAVRSAWERIANHLDRRDAHEREKHGDPPRTLQQMTLDYIQYPVGMWIGGAVTGPIMRVLSFPTDLVGPLGVAALAALAARRYPSARHLLGGVSLGIALLFVAISVSVASTQFQ